jgi:hypothetical protein
MKAAFLQSFFHTDFLPGTMPEKNRGKFPMPLLI